MLKRIFAVCVMVMPASAWAAEFYADIAVGLTRAEWALPEVDLPSPLIRGAVGVEGQYGWALELEHISSIQKAEQGTGLNVLWVRKRIRF